MKYKYKKITPQILRPIIPVELINGEKSIKYEALVDSGADLCIFPAELGEIIGIDIISGQKEEVGGITGKKEFYYLHKIKAGFLPKFPQLGYGVLGQKGFFDIYIIKFDLIKEIIELKERNY